jgi:hypothetical protein
MKKRGDLPLFHVVINILPLCKMILNETDETNSGLCCLYDQCYVSLFLQKIKF